MGIDNVLRIFGLQKFEQEDPRAEPNPLANLQPTKPTTPDADQFQRKLAGIVIFLGGVSTMTMIGLWHMLFRLKPMKVTISWLYCGQDGF